MNKTIKAVVLESPDVYVPKLVPVNIVLHEGYPIAIHRIKDGAGTHLYSLYQQKNTKFVELSDEDVKKICA